MVRTALLGVMIVVFGAMASTATPDTAVPELAGMYACKGTNPDGEAYEGVVEITRVEDTYRVLWALNDNTSVMGIGIFSNGVLAVSYFGGAPAVVVYKVDGSRLVGEWTMGGAEGAVYAETLTKVPVPPQRRKPAGNKPASFTQVARL